MSLPLASDFDSGRVRELNEQTAAEKVSVRFFWDHTTTADDSCEASLAPTCTAFTVSRHGYALLGSSDGTICAAPPLRDVGAEALPHFLCWSQLQLKRFRIPPPKAADDGGCYSRTDCRVDAIVSCEFCRDDEIVAACFLGGSRVVILRLDMDYGDDGHENGEWARGTSWSAVHEVCLSFPSGSPKSESDPGSSKLGTYTYSPSPYAHCWANRDELVVGCESGAILTVSLCDLSRVHSQAEGLGSGSAVRLLVLEDSAIVQMCWDALCSALLVSTLRRTIVVRCDGGDPGACLRGLPQITVVGTKPRDAGSFGACFATPQYKQPSVPGAGYVYAARHNGRVFEALTGDGTVLRTYRVPKGTQLGLLLPLPVSEVALPSCETLQLQVAGDGDPFAYIWSHGPTFANIIKLCQEPLCVFTCRIPHGDSAVCSAVCGLSAFILLRSGAILRVRLGLDDKPSSRINPVRAFASLPEVADTHLSPSSAPQPSLATLVTSVHPVTKVQSSPRSIVISGTDTNSGLQWSPNTPRQRRVEANGETSGDATAPKSRRTKVVKKIVVKKVIKRKDPRGTLGGKDESLQLEAPTDQARSEEEDKATLSQDVLEMSQLPVDDMMEADVGQRIARTDQETLLPEPDARPPSRNLTAAHEVPEVAFTSATAPFAPVAYPTASCREQHRDCAPKDVSEGACDSVAVAVAPEIGCVSPVRCVGAVAQPTPEPLSLTEADMRVSGAEIGDKPGLVVGEATAQEVMDGPLQELVVGVVAELDGAAATADDEVGHDDAASDESPVSLTTSCATTQPAQAASEQGVAADLVVSPPNYESCDRRCRSESVHLRAQRSISPSDCASCLPGKEGEVIFSPGVAASSEDDASRLPKGSAITCDDADDSQPRCCESLATVSVYTCEQEIRQVYRVYVARFLIKRDRPVLFASIVRLLPVIDDWLLLRFSAAGEESAGHPPTARDSEVSSGSLGNEEGRGDDILGLHHEPSSQDVLQQSVETMLSSAFDWIAYHEPQRGAVHALNCEPALDETFGPTAASAPEINTRCKLVATMFDLYTRLPAVPAGAKAQLCERLLATYGSESSFVELLLHIAADGVRWQQLGGESQTTAFLPLADSGVMLGKRRSPAAMSLLRGRRAEAEAAEASPAGTPRFFGVSTGSFAPLPPFASEAERQLFSRRQLLERGTSQTPDTTPSQRAEQGGAEGRAGGSRADLTLLETQIVTLTVSTLDTLENLRYPLCALVFYFPYLFAALPSKAISLAVSQYPSISIAYWQWALASVVQGSAVSVLRGVGCNVERLLFEDLADSLADLVLLLLEVEGECIRQNVTEYTHCLRILLQRRFTLLRGTIEAQQHVYRMSEIAKSAAHSGPVVTRSSGVTASRGSYVPPEIVTDALPARGGEFAVASLAAVTSLAQRKLKRLEDALRGLLPPPHGLCIATETLISLLDEYEYPEGFIASDLANHFILLCIKEQRLERLLRLFQTPGGVPEVLWIKFLFAAHGAQQLEAAMFLCLTAEKHPKRVRYLLRRAFPMLGSPSECDEQLNQVAMKLRLLIGEPPVA